MVGGGSPGSCGRLCSAVKIEHFTEASRFPGAWMRSGGNYTTDNKKRLQKAGVRGERLRGQ
eukprot:261652-Pyramimonas_sp.AAC.1